MGLLCTHAHRQRHKSCTISLWIFGFYCWLDWILVHPFHLRCTIFWAIFLFRPYRLMALQIIWSALQHSFAGSNNHITICLFVCNRNKLFFVIYVILGPMAIVCVCVFLVGRGFFLLVLIRKFDMHECSKWYGMECIVKPTFYAKQRQ